MKQRSVEFMSHREQIMRRNFRAQAFFVGFVCGCIGATLGILVTVAVLR